VAIVPEDVARVRAATDFLALVGEHVSLRRVGRRHVGLCPFHPEKTPSFSVNGEEGLYHCYGCQAGGDAITFVREIEHLDFVEAVEWLAARANIQLTYTDDGPARQDRQERTRLLEALAKAADWYHERLLSGSDAAPARAYLRSRGYDSEIVRFFKLGWAPNHWDALARALALPEAVLRRTGLGSPDRNGRPRDAFRGRVMFPIFDVAGNAVAFGGRIMPGGEGPKYINSQETPVYAKRKVLYGLNWAKAAVVEAAEVVVCEGYTDVIGFFVAGVPRAVATCGTALADEHVRLLKGFAPRVVLAYDADNAGQAAAERFYAWEQREKVDLAVASFPGGADPADVARTDPASLKAAVEEARSFLAFRIERVLEGADMRTPEGRARAAEQAMLVIAEHPNANVRDQYERQLADRCRIDLAVLRSTQARRAGSGRSAPVDPLRLRPKDLGGTTEVEVLRLAIHRPEEMAALVGQLETEHADEVLFADDANLAAFRALAGAETLHDAIEQADPHGAALLRQLSVEEPDTDVDDVIARCVASRARPVLAELESTFRSSPELAQQLAGVVAWLKLTMEQLDEPRTRIDAIGRLVPWLASRVHREPEQ
jgi:DNA primase